MKRNDQRWKSGKRERLRPDRGQAVFRSWAVVSVSLRLVLCNGSNRQTTSDSKEPECDFIPQFQRFELPLNKLSTHSAIRGTPDQSRSSSFEIHISLVAARHYIDRPEVYERNLPLVKLGAAGFVGQVP
jgi:hypothetical protein